MTALKLVIRHADSLSGTNGARTISTWGASTPAEAWWRACEAARAVGMFGPIGP
jgi:hypothetical protein